MLLLLANTHMNNKVKIVTAHKLLVTVEIMVVILTQLGLRLRTARCWVDSRMEMIYWKPMSVVYIMLSLLG